ncbi:MAG: hypothetical protein A3H31_12820 [Gallionellales bacterium RIFCSPLOWO2_02_FULL_57_47]|nr:MAG: hypothetical protein A3H31_12820 [Gallionellales bacterium RIFCSPLOWO2_02_FULL_57_47]OGT16292.1 MAG: hypothetical protein A3J49_09130 [Gallionellales bacterium RIFCSPHIGHO2_02_FULL_57_16]
MNEQTLLLRQIHPSFVQAGRPTSQAFRPTPKDENKLSVYDGDKITPEAAWHHFTANPDCSSAGVMAVTKGQCVDLSLGVIADGEIFPEHVSIDYSAFAKSEIEKKAKVLKGYAQARGWLYQPM